MVAATAMLLEHLSRQLYRLISTCQGIEFNELLRRKAMLPKTAEYALRAAVWLGRDPDQTETADHLAEQTKVPRRYLHKVLQDLVSAGLVRSQSGPGGGYALARRPEKITILDVVNSVAPLERIRHCPLGLSSHTRLCPLHKELDRVFAATERALARVTIAQLLRSASPILPLCEISQ
jgi:Rrf2 family transcriptional regulator, nitric oxide-sensitive transcriptional repressor